MSGDSPTCHFGTYNPLHNHSRYFTLSACSLMQVKSKGPHSPEGGKTAFIHQGLQFPEEGGAAVRLARCLHARDSKPDGICQESIATAS
jgi:hypothetical protein